MPFLLVFICRLAKKDRPLSLGRKLAKKALPLSFGCKPQKDFPFIRIFRILHEERPFLKVAFVRELC